LEEAQGATIMDVREMRFIELWETDSFAVASEARHLVLKIISESSRNRFSPCVLAMSQVQAYNRHSCREHVYHNGHACLESFAWLLFP
jgi:hypothetical protein